ncbi:MAG TPA: cryptochrome/photolyase family protein, partial [Vampirovibrionales bacterium]
MSKTLRLILADQLTLSLASLKTIDPKSDLVLMAEVKSEATYVKHHKKKIAFLFSAMRHFAFELKSLGYRVKYVKYDDKDNQGSLFQEVAKAVKEDQLSSIEVTHPGEYRVLKDIESWQEGLNIPVTIHEDNRFLSSPEYFKKWAKGRKQLRMEYFYREMRKDHNYLMEGDKPVGGEWNYDNSNREAIKGNVDIPTKTSFKPDSITKEVLELVKKEFADHFGSLEGFDFAVTRDQALEVLNHFIQNRLPNFGKYQDAMLEGEAWLFHSHISFYLNCGLLLPKEVLDKAEEAYTQGKAPLNSVEGF